MPKRFSNPPSLHNRNHYSLTVTAPHLCSPSPSPSPDVYNQIYRAGFPDYDRGENVGWGHNSVWGYTRVGGDDSQALDNSSMPDLVPGRPTRSQQSTPVYSRSPYPTNTPSPMPDEHPVSPTLVEQFRALNRPSPRGPRQQRHNLGQRLSHRRLPSGSSIGSAGPESPYTPTLAFPHIVGADTPPASSPHSDSLESGYQGPGNPRAVSPYILSAVHGDLLAPEFQNYNPWSSDPENIKAAEAAMARAMEEQRRGDTGQLLSLLPHHSPPEGLDEERSRLTVGAPNPVPTLDRTISDACQDELYNPSMAVIAPPSEPSPYGSQSYRHSQQNPVFTEILQVANENHLSARPGTSVSREHSPFRQTSEFAADRFPHTAATPHSPATRVNPAASPRPLQHGDAAARNYHLPTMQRDTAAARTISPKESLLHCSEAEEDAKMPLFPQETVHRRENQFRSTTTNSRPLARGDVDHHHRYSPPRHDPVSTSRRPHLSSSAATPPIPSGPDFTFMPPSLPSIPSHASMSQQYPFISNSRRQSSSRRSASDADPDPPFPAPLSSMESTKSDGDPLQLTRFISAGDGPQRSSPSPDVGRPSDTVAGTGSYACAVPGCSQRFDTAAKLQRHKRDSHRADPPPPPRSPSTPTIPPSASAGHPPGSSATAANRNSQAGPHKCTRLNPNTNKPCNTVFSRSYDLTRHEETVHNRSKVKIQCALCTVEKTFSRGDALSRHARVMHPGVEYPGKTKKRGS